jgi:small membrane protein
VNGFQWLTCTLLGAALRRDLLPRRGRTSPATVRIARMLVWIAAMAAIVDPLGITRLANLLGIGRGADIVLYAFVLAFVMVTFYFYAQQLRLRREVSALASHIALMEATRGHAAAPPPDQTP